MKTPKRITNIFIVTVAKVDKGSLSLMNCNEIKNLIRVILCLEIRNLILHLFCKFMKILLPWPEGV